MRYPQYRLASSLWSKGNPGQGGEWSAKQAFLGLLLAVVLGGGVGIALTPITLVWDSESGAALAVGALATLAFELGLVLIVLKLTLWRGSDLDSLGLGRNHRWHLTASAAALGLSYLALYTYLAVIGLLDLSALEPAGQIAESTYDHPIVVGLLGVSVVVLAPFAEELFFRGFLFRGLSNSFGVVPGALVSGFIFSLAHINLGAIIPFTLIGAIFALSYQRTGSLWTPIATHFAFNAISFSILLLVPEARN